MEIYDLTALENERALRRALGWMSAGLTLLLLSWYASLTLIAVFFGRYFDQTLWLFFNEICLYGVSAPLFLLCVLRVRPDPAPKRPLRFSRWLTAFLISVFLIQTAATVTNYFMSFLGGVIGYDFVDRIQSMTVDVPLWASFLIVVAVGPLGEEFLFRRLLCDRLRFFGEWPAALVSALLFALYHTNVFQFGYTFLLGLLLAYVYLKTGRLRYSYALHAAVNFCFGFVADLVNRYGDVSGLQDWLEGGLTGVPEINWTGLAVYVLYLTLVNGGIVAGLVLLIVNRRRIRWEDGDGSLPRGRVAVRMLRSPFLWVCLCVSALLSLLSL